MWFSQSLIPLALVASVAASPLAGLFARQDVPDQPDVDFGQLFDGGSAFTTLEPISEDNSTVLGKRGVKKFDLKDQITLQWKNGL
jgi:hypothetical protein